MHLYIASGETNLDIPNISLHSGFEPTICGQSYSGGNFESAIWFKVMVVDAISLDCNNRRLSWVPRCPTFISHDSGFVPDERTPEIPDFQPGCGYVSVNNDECDLSNVDGVFNDVTDLVARYQNEAITKETLYQKMFEVIHFYILPNIQLSARDADNIESYLQLHETFIQDIDSKIVTETSKRDGYKQAYSKLRNQFVGELLLSERNSYSVLSKQFIDLLTCDLNRDIKEIDDVLRYDDSAAAELQSERKKLETAKQKLAEIGRRHGTLRRIRDAFVTATNEPIQNVYMAMNSTLAGQAEEIKVLTDRKLLILSVKEAARDALTSVRSGEDYSIDVNSSGAACTDVLGGRKASAMRSLAERIASILKDSTSQLSKKHRDFCIRITERCAAAAQEKALFDELSKNTTDASFDSDDCIGGFDVVDVRHSDLDSTTSFGSLPHARTAHHSFQNENRTGSLTRSLPVNLPLNEGSSGVVSSSTPVRSISAYTDNSDGRGVSRMNVRSLRLMQRRSKGIALSPSFTSYLPPLVSLTEKNTANCSTETVSRDSDSPVLIFDLNKIQCLSESVKDEILEHMNSMCSEFQQILALKVARGLQYHEIWANYENCLYAEIMDTVTKLYQLQYSSVTTELCRSLETLTPLDLDLCEACLVHMLEDGRSDTPLSPDGVFTSSPPVIVESANEQAPSLGSVESSELKGTCAKTAVSDNRTFSEAGSQSDLSDDGLGALRRCLSDDGDHKRLRTMRVSMRVNAFKADRPHTVIVYERKLNTVIDEDMETEGSFESAGLAVQPAMIQTMKLKLRYRSLFLPVLNSIQAAVVAQLPSAKLRHLTRCLRQTGQLVAQFYGELFGRPASESGCDELMDALVILLCNIDANQLSLLYCQVKFLVDILPEWMQYGPHCFTLMQFTGACQFIQDRLVCKRNKLIQTANAATSQC